eukprot:505302_1
MSTLRPYHLKRHNHKDTAILIYAYLRQYVALDIIPDIINVCQQFYEPLFIWDMNHDVRLKQLQNPKIAESSTIQSKTFSYNNIRFKLLVYPNDTYEGSGHGVTQFECNVLSCPNCIESFTIYCEFFCLETGVEHKSTVIFQRLHVDPPYELFVLKKVQRLSDFFGLKQITFGLYFDVLSIQYNDTYDMGRYLKYLRHPKIDIELESEWFINENMVDIFKTCANGQCFYSDSFGVSNNFCLVCFPNGHDFRTIGNLALGIKLLTLPWKVSRILIDYKLKVSYDGSEAKSFSVSSTTGLSYRSCIKGWRNGTFTRGMLNSVDSVMSFGVSIQVTEMYDLNSESIDKSKWWPKYTSSV